MARSIGEWEFTSEQAGRAGLSPLFELAQAVAQTSGGASLAISGGSAFDGSGAQAALTAQRVGLSLASARQLQPRTTRRLTFD